MIRRNVTRKAERCVHDHLMKARFEHVGEEHIALEETEKHYSGVEKSGGRVSM